MGRLVRIAIYALIILILYFWVTAILKSYARKSVKEVGPTEIVDSLKSDTVTEYYTNEESNYTGEDKLITNQDIVDGKIDYTTVDRKVKEMESKKVTSTPATKQTQTTTKTEKSEPVVKTAKEKNTKTISGDGGKYLVMAGSYLLKDNAKKMVSKLKTMGYTKAEVIVFTSSEYHSVIAARFSSESDARTASAQLKRKGIESFIKQK